MMNLRVVTLEVKFTYSPYTTNFVDTKIATYQMKTINF